MLTLTCTFTCESHFSTKWETNLKKLMQRLDESYVYLCTWEIKLSQRKIGASTQNTYRHYPQGRSENIQCT